MIELQQKFIKEIESDISNLIYAGQRELTKSELKRRNEVHPDLRLLYDEARIEMLKEQSPLVHPMDIYLVCGNRNKEDQTKAVAGGFSKVFWPNGKHNIGRDKSVTVDGYCSDAMDCAPIKWNGVKYELDWNDLKAFKYMVDLMMRVAKRLESEGKIKKIRFGADFNQDGNLKNDKFVDLPHVEVVLV